MSEERYSSRETHGLAKIQLQGRLQASQALEAGSNCYKALRCGLLESRLSSEARLPNAVFKLA